MSNLSPITYWISNIIFDFCLFTLILIIRIIGVKVFSDDFGFLTFSNHLAVLVLVLILFMVATLLFSYVLSYFSKSKSGSYILVLVQNIIGCVLAMYYYKMTIPKSMIPIEYRTGFWPFVVKCIVLFSPPMNYAVLFIKLFSNWYDITIDQKPQTSNTTESPYLVFASEKNPNGMLFELSFMAGDIVIYIVLLACIQMGYLEKFWNLIILQYYKETDVKGTDEYGHDVDVSIEENAVDSLVATNNSADPANRKALICYHLKKNYLKWFRPFLHPFFAVQDVTFQVNSGECFGLLGVNGAGKSTTFKMLTAEILPTSGDSCISGGWRSRNKSSYLSKSGYCAQSNCFLPELTGRELLTCIAKLRGVDSNSVTRTVNKWLHILGLEEYQDQACGSYSGGNKRKLCTSLSLIGDPQVVFLDEPTSGVDPESRNKLYSVMGQTKRAGQTVVLTSHSMEECENLCDRLTILVKGKMKCIGPVQHLKTQYAKGFSVIIKLVDGIGNDPLINLKGSMEISFRCTLKDEHMTQLHYQIVDTQLKWSTIFGVMENIKHNHQECVEDYSVTDTSLEEVFIGFAKMSSEE